MKKTLFVLFCLFFAYGESLPNAAAPGFYNPGAGGEIQLFYPQDSIALVNIQMQSEQITIQLYEGFAVVRGEYFMYNHSDSALHLHTGYPINHYYDHEDFHITTDSLHALQVFVNEQEMQVGSLAQDPELHDKAYNLSNWYVWETEFAPRKITKITIFYIVNTNQATVRQGYNLDRVQGFAYLLESGQGWAKKIDKGRVFVQLMQDLTLESIQGIKPDSVFRADSSRKALFFYFSDLEPTPNHNIYIRYSTQKEDFDMQAVLNNAQNYYEKIKQVKIPETYSPALPPFYPPDLLKVYDKSGGGMLQIIAMALGIPILLIILLIILIVWLVRRRNRRITKKQ